MFRVFSIAMENYNKYEYCNVCAYDKISSFFSQFSNFSSFNAKLVFLANFLALIFCLFFSYTIIMIKHSSINPCSFLFPYVFDFFFDSFSFNICVYFSQTFDRDSSSATATQIPLESQFAWSKRGSLIVSVSVANKILYLIIISSNWTRGKTSL